MRSLVIGDTGGIGTAIRAELAERGEVIGLSRSRDGLDLTDEDSIRACLGGLTGSFDMVFIVTGQLGTPEKALAQLTPAEMAGQFAVNAMGPALVIKHLVPYLPRDHAAWVGVLSARVGSIGDNHLGGWHSYRASKAALNQLMRGAAIELKRRHPQLVLACLHPGTVDTPFTKGYARDKLEPAQAARALIGVLQALPPDQTGTFHDYAGKPVPW